MNTTVCRPTGQGRTNPDKTKLSGKHYPDRHGHHLIKVSSCPVVRQQREPEEELPVLLHCLYSRFSPLGRAVATRWYQIRSGRCFPRTICSFHIGSVARVVQLQQRFPIDIRTISPVAVSTGEAVSSIPAANPTARTNHEGEQTFTLTARDALRTCSEPARSSNA